MKSAGSALIVAEKIQHSMSLPLVVEGQELLLSCRIGGAVAPQDGTDAESLLDKALTGLSRTHANGSVHFVSAIADDAPLPPHYLPPSSTSPAEHSRSTLGARR
jgi:GGDEF domain-containing protein